MLKGSAQLTSEDVGGDAEAQDQFSLKEINPERERGNLLTLSQKSRHRETGGAMVTEEPKMISYCAMNFL